MVVTVLSVAFTLNIDVVVRYLQLVVHNQASLWKFSFFVMRGNIVQNRDMKSADSMFVELWGFLQYLS